MQSDQTGRQDTPTGVSFFHWEGLHSGRYHRFLVVSIPQLGVDKDVIILIGSPPGEDSIEDTSSI